MKKMVAALIQLKGFHKQQVLVLIKKIQMIYFDKTYKIEYYLI